MDKLTVYYELLNKESIKIPNEPYFISQRKYEKIPAISPIIARILYMLVKIKRPETILEIGYGSGYSSTAIHESLKDMENIDFTSLERNHERFDRGLKYIKAKKLKIKLLYEDFFEYIKFISGKKFDFIFVDSVKKQYSLILEKAYPILNPNGVIVFDNISFEGKVIGLTANQIPKYCDSSNKLNQFNHLCSKHKGLRFSFLNIDDGLAIGVKI